MPAFYTAALCLCIVADRPASAANDTWNGGAAPDGNWTTAGNWNGVAPGTNDLLIFAGSTQTATTNDYSAGTPFNNIFFSSGASAFTANGNLVTISEPTDAGSGQISGGSINNASASAETFHFPIFFANGNHKISSSGGPLRFNGTITHDIGSVVTMSGNINASGGLSTDGNANGILGGWAICSNDWATLDGSSNVIAYASYTDVSPGGTIASDSSSNVRIPTSGSAVSITAPTTAINSLLYSGGTAAQTVNVGAGNTLVLGQNGGVYNSSSIASGGTYMNLTIGASVADGGILTAGDGINPATIYFGSPPLASGSAGFIRVQSSIQDNGSAPVTVVIAGAYASFNGSGPGFGSFQTNTYSGGTYILQGRFSQANSYSIGTGPVYIFPGGQVNTGWPITNEFFIEGSGTTENNGMGALRLYSASSANGITGNLPGTIHLTGIANVCADNDVNLDHMLGFSGKITGPGSLGIGSPTATSRSGIINIGSTNGAYAIPNDYAGDTRINGINGGTRSSTLRIADPADNNIMPHGSTGSYAGGATGNLILDGVAASRQAILDLNGSTQTINGLSSTSTDPADNIVTDSTGGGSLILGDNDATATFGGIIQSGLSITKIGTGTETLSGANTYTGDTTVQAGALVANTTATGTGNYSISDNAALGVNVASAGTTLAVNNLTCGSSASAINLNTGATGNPGAPIVSVYGALAMPGDVNISLSGVDLTAGGPFTVLTYNSGSRTGPGHFILKNSPRIVATLNDDMAGNVTVTIISADTAVKWNGGSDGNWDVNDTGNTIWQTVPSDSTTYYIESGSGNDVALFDDSLTGTNSVNLTTALTPQGLTVSNSSVNYFFTGSGKLTGATGLTKDGTGTLTIANSGNNDFSGPIALIAGTLVISNNSSIGNTITGSGALVKNGSGTLTLSGDGSGYSGAVSVNAGTLKVLNGTSLATASGTTIASGATLDIGNNNVALGLEPITVSGSGVGASGAIVNSSGYSLGAIATSFQNVTLTGDTTIGGPGRLDFRSSDPDGGNDATLNTGGQPYKLTKVSINTLQLGSVQVDPALGDIDVQAGTLGIQGYMPSLGNPSSNLTVFGGATVQFLNMATEVNKVLILKDGAIVNNSGGSTLYDGPVTLQGNSFFKVGGASMTFTNVISGAGSLSQVSGTGTLYLNASNTYTGDTLIGAGTMYLTEPAGLENSPAITIGTAGTLDVTGRNDQTLTVSAGHSLTGSGTLAGNLTNLPASTLSVGTPDSIGTLIVYYNTTLQGTTFMKLNKDTLNSDLLYAGGILTFGGTLNVTNLAGSLADGDSFQIFSAGGFDGAFSQIVPATPGAGLLWDTNSLASSGVLNITAAPQPFAITNFTLSASSLTLQGAGGTPNAAYVLLTTTNVALPLAQWTPMITNYFDNDGGFNFTTNINNSLPQQFYLLSQ